MREGTSAKADRALVPSGPEPLQVSAFGYDPLRGEGRDTAEGSLSYISDLMAKNYEAVGFLPTPRLEEYLRRGQVLLQTENDEPCGYLAFGGGWPILKVYQCCIQYDARRLDHATDLVNRLVAIARKRGCTAVSLWCADDLDANSFWRASGFHFGGRREGGTRRGRMHNRWTIWINDAVQSDLFITRGMIRDSDTHRMAETGAGSGRSLSSAVPERQSPILNPLITHLTEKPHDPPQAADRRSVDH